MVAVVVVVSGLTSPLWRWRIQTWVRLFFATTFGWKAALSWLIAIAALFCERHSQPLWFGLALSDDDFTDGMQRWALPTVS